MNESAHSALLDPDESRRHVRENLGEELAYLTDLVNYGTHLIVRTLGPAADTITKQVVCGALLKHVVGMLDAAVVLLENGHSTHAFPQARSAFEASLYIEFILKGQPEHRAQTYLVSDYRARRAFALSVLDDTNAPGSFNAKFATIGVKTSDLDPRAKALARQQITQINDALRRPPLDHIERSFQSYANKKRREAAWYQCLGFASLHQVAKDLDQAAAYSLWYGHGSSVMHADSFSRQVLTQEDHAVLKPIRHLEDAHEICGAVGQIALKTYRVILTYYRPLELPALQQKYLRDWRKTFRSSKAITYDFRLR